jgi:hypothetical protein
MTASILEKIRLIPIVSDVKHVEGVYDIIARLDTPSYDTMKQTVAYIRTIGGIKSGITLQKMRSTTTIQEWR